MTNGKEKNGWNGATDGSQETIENADCDFSSNQNKHDELHEKAKNDVTKDLIDQLYREGGMVGDGGTADAVISEALSNEPTFGKWHATKAMERARQIDRILRKNLAPGDEELLKEERGKLLKALIIWNEAKKK